MGLYDFGFYDLIDGLVGDIYKQSSKIPRLAAHSGQEHYQPDLEEMDELFQRYRRSRKKRARGAELAMELGILIVRATLGR